MRSARDERTRRGRRRGRGRRDGAGVGGLEKEGVARRISCLSSQGAVFSLSLLRELEHTSFCEVGGLVGFCGADGTHLGEHDVASEVGGLQCGFGAGEAAADYVNLFHLL